MGDHEDIGVKVEENDGERTYNVDEEILERGERNVEEDWDCECFEVLRQKNKANSTSLLF